MNAESSSHLFQNNGDLDTLIITFASFQLNMSGIPRFEFFNYLNKEFSEYDHSFLIDKKYCWYNRGIEGCSESVEKTVEYINEHIKGYRKVLFMGTSSGGYAAILFASLCKVEGVTNSVVAFRPQTDLQYVTDRKSTLPSFVVTNWNDLDSKYTNLKNVMRSDVRYDIVSHPNDKDTLHNWHHTTNIKDLDNVHVHLESRDLRTMRSSGMMGDVIRLSIG